MLKTMWCALATMGLLLLLVVVLGRFNPRAAARVMEIGQTRLFEPEPEESLTPRSRAAPIAAVKRAYISPFSKKQVASSQKWRCAICGRLLDPAYEIDHKLPLSRGGTNDKSNLQAICHSPCHIEKSAREASSRARGRS